MKMAEAVVESPRNRFYCHQCSREITPHLPDYTCPRCQSGFIEEIAEDFEDQQEEEANDSDPAVQFAEMWGRTFLDSFRVHAQGQPGPEGEAQNGGPSRAHMYPHGHHPSIRVAIGRRHSRQGPAAPRNAALETIIQQLIGGLTGQQGLARGGGIPGMPGLFSMYGNPGDYAWGVGGLDAIITQLMNQLEGAGAPPAPPEKIDELPTVNVTQEQVDRTLQCSVCMDDYELNEPVRQLPCDHLYHNDCIVPWLKQHGTCPVCRKTLDGKIYTDEAPLGMPPDMDSNTSSQP